MNVALLTLDFPPNFIGGVSAWAMDMAIALHRAGHTVTVYAKHTGDTTSHDAALPFSVRRVRGRSWARWGGWWMRLALVGRLQHYDQILCATWPLAVRLPSIPRLGVAVHGSEVTCLETAPPALTRLARTAHAWFPVSAFLASELDRLALPCRQVAVLPMPLETNAGAAPERGDHLVCVARDTPRKGVDRAIQIAEATGRSIRLIGTSASPPNGEAYGELSRAETIAQIRGARALVLTPRAHASGRGAEGLGLCILEAASVGVPSIGCDVGGVREALGPGLLLTDPDHPDGGAINAWLTDDGHGQRAQAWVGSHHGPQRAVATLMRELR